MTPKIALLLLALLPACSKPDPYRLTREQILEQEARRAGEITIAFDDPGPYLPGSSTTSSVPVAGGEAGGEMPRQSVTCGGHRYEIPRTPGFYYEITCYENAGGGALIVSRKIPLEPK